MIQVLSKYKTVVGILVISGILVSAGVFAFRWHKSEVEKAVTEERLRVSKETLLAVEQAYRQKAQAELSMQDKLQDLQRKKDEQIRSISKHYDAIIAGLRDRPNDRQTGENYTNSTAETTTETGATGLQLSRPDAEFLARFARDTAELQAELKACIRDYESVREIVNNFGK